MISSLYSSPIDSIGREKAEPKSDSCCRQVTSAFSKRPWRICFSLDRYATSHFDRIARFPFAAAEILPRRRILLFAVLSNSSEVLDFGGYSCILLHGLVLFCCVVVYFMLYVGIVYM